MALSPKTKTFSILLFSLLIIESCTLTTTKTKSAILNEPSDSLQTALKQIVSCENFNVDGKEITTDGKTNSVLEIDIVNGHGIPADENQMNALGKRVAVTVKDALQDKNEYNVFKVLFVTIEENGGVTKKTWTGKIFKSGEL